MRKNANLEIKKLKKSLLKNEIEIVDAIDQFVIILDGFQEFKDEELIIDYSFMKSSVNRNLLNKNNLVKERIKSLNRIIVLQELGVKFDKDEINILLTK